MDEDTPRDSSEQFTLVLFDGVCNLCNGWVDFLLQRDKKRRLKFASLQSDPARELLQSLGVDPDKIDSIVFFRNQRAWQRSDAVARIVAELGFPYNVASIFRLLPRPIRDAVYDWVAKHRYRWFGQRDNCRLPTPEERAQFWPDGA